MTKNYLEELRVRQHFTSVEPSQGSQPGHKQRFKAKIGRSQGKLGLQTTTRFIGLPQHPTFDHERNPLLSDTWGRSYHSSINQRAELEDNWSSSSRKQCNDYQRRNLPSIRKENGSRPHKFCFQAKYYFRIQLSHPFPRIPHQRFSVTNDGYQEKKSPKMES